MVDLSAPKSVALSLLHFSLSQQEHLPQQKTCCPICKILNPWDAFFSAVKKFPQTALLIDLTRQQNHAKLPSLARAQQRNITFCFHNLHSFLCKRLKNWIIELFYNISSGFNNSNTSKSTEKSANSLQNITENHAKNVRAFSKNVGDFSKNVGDFLKKLPRFFFFVGVLKGRLKNITTSAQEISSTNTA